MELHHRLPRWTDAASTDQVCVLTSDTPDVLCTEVQYSILCLNPIDFIMTNVIIA